MSSFHSSGRCIIKAPSANGNDEARPVDGRTGHCDGVEAELLDPGLEGGGKKKAVGEGYLMLR